MSAIQKYALILMAVALLFPSAVSISHIYAHDKHIACTNFLDPHFHKDSLDCELCDLQSNSFFSFQPANYNLYQPVVADKKFYNNYQFLSDYQKLSFKLRGPPVLILFS